MSGIVVIFVVGLANLCLGYAMAVQLGYRPADNRRSEILGSVEEPSPQTAAEEVKQPEQPEPFELDETTLNGLIEELLSNGDELPELHDPEREDEAADQDLDQEVEPQTSHRLEAGESSLAGQLLAVRGIIDRHLDWLIDLDTRIRQTANENDPFTLIAWLEEFREGCQTQLDKQLGSRGSALEKPDDLQGLGGCGEKLIATVADHSAKLEQAATLPEEARAQDDFQAAVAKLLEAIDAVQMDAHRLRDSLDEAFLVAVRTKDRLHDVDESLKIDSLTEFPSRIGLETILAEWWTAGGGRARPLAGVLFDLDCFAEVNQIHGLKASDGILRATAEWIAGQAGDEEVLARYGGKRLLLASFNRSVSDAMKRAEQVRQSIANTCFLRADARIHITLSVGVAAALLRETPEAFLSRLEAATAAAKQSGRNSSFLHSGHQTDLIDPPELDIEPQEVPV